MRFTKDSFYMALRDRLTALNPARVAWINGVERPALLVMENELVSSAALPLETFVLTWGEIKTLDAVEPASLIEISCNITYATEGTEEFNGQDRGRNLTQMDEELLAITRPGKAALKDHSQLPPQDLEKTFFWSRPEFKDVEAKGPRLHRTARLSVYNFAEGNW